MRALGGISALIVLATAVALLLAADPGDRETRQSQATGAQAAGARHVADTNLLDDGRRLYLMTCASCHGAGGEGTDFAPALTDVGAAANDFYMRTGRMPLGRLGIPTWEQERQLTDEQIAAIVAYTSTFGEGPAIPEVATDLADFQRGWALYINDCAACHGAAGGGGGIGGGVVAPPLHDADPLTVAEAMLIGPGAMPQFLYPQEDVNSIAAYVQFLRDQPSPGGIQTFGAGPVPEGLIAGLIGVGLLVLVARWIARRPEFEPEFEPEPEPGAPALPAVGQPNDVEPRT